MRLQDLRDAIHAGRIRITDHADEEAAADRLTLAEILHSAVAGEIIEEYPDDRPFPSCLVLGRTPEKKPVHSVWAYHSEKAKAFLITVYRPDPDLWIDWRRRKKR
jgi:hypothetical protein